MSRLSELQEQRDKISAEIAELSNALNRFKEWCQSAPQENHELRTKLFTLLVDSTIADKFDVAGIDRIRSEIDLIDLRLEQKDAILHELRERIYATKLSTGIDQINAEIAFIHASELYPALRGKIIRAGRLQSGQREELISLGKQARKGSEARRLVAELKERTDRNDHRVFTFECDQD